MNFNAWICLVDTPFRYDLLSNPLVPMTRILVATNLISIVCGTQWAYKPQSGPIQFKPKPNYDSRIMLKSLKAHFWPNWIKTYKRYIHRVFDTYTLNLWHTHILDKSLKSLIFHFGEILGQLAWSIGCPNVPNPRSQFFLYRPPLSPSKWSKFSILTETLPKYH